MHETLYKELREIPYGIGVASASHQSRTDPAVIALETRPKRARVLSPRNNKTPASKLKEFLR
jgi:hypothetical protein